MRDVRSFLVSNVGDKEVQFFIIAYGVLVERRPRGAMTYTCTRIPA